MPRQIQYDNNIVIKLFYHNIPDILSLLGFTWRHKFHWESTPNRYTVIRLKKFPLYGLTLCLAANVCNFVRFACSSAVQSSIHFGLTPTQNYWKRFQWNPRIAVSDLSLCKKSVNNILRVRNCKQLISNLLQVGQMQLINSLWANTRYSKNILRWNSFCKLDAQVENNKRLKL